MRRYRLGAYGTMGCVALLAASLLGTAPARADSITINDITYDGVYVTQTNTLYFVRFPETGQTQSFPADQVAPGSFQKSEDREALRAQWRQAANIDPQRLLEERDPTYQAPEPVEKNTPTPLGGQVQFESNLSRADRERGVLERERVVGRDGTYSLVLRGNQKPDRTVDAEIQRYIQEQQMLRQQQEQQWMAYQQELQEAQRQAEQEALEAAYQDYLRGLNLSQQELQMRERALRVDAQAMRNEWMRRFGGYGNVPHYYTPYGWYQAPVFIQPGGGDGDAGESAGNQSPGMQYNNHGGIYTGSRRQMDRLNVPDHRTTYPWSQGGSGGNRHQSAPRNTYPWSTTPADAPDEAE